MVGCTFMSIKASGMRHRTRMTIEMHAEKSKVDQHSLEWLLIHARTAIGEYEDEEALGNA